MLPGSPDQRVLGFLGRALSLEFSAVQMYSTQARLLEAWGLAGEAARFRDEAGEEMGHAERIISRMLALGVSPNASQLRPVRVEKSLLELLQGNHAFESELVNMYDEATRHCARIGDQENRLFFEALLEEEKAHARELESWIARL